MSIQIPNEEQIKSWREDFETMLKLKAPLHSLERDDSGYMHMQVDAIYEGYISAKSSSYERILELEKELERLKCTKQ